MVSYHVVVFLVWQGSLGGSNPCPSFPFCFSPCKDFQEIPCSLSAFPFFSGFEGFSRDKKILVFLWWFSLPSLRKKKKEQRKDRDRKEIPEKERDFRLDFAE